MDDHKVIAVPTPPLPLGGGRGVWVVKNDCVVQLTQNLYSVKILKVFLNCAIRKQKLVTLRKYVENWHVSWIRCTCFMDYQEQSGFMDQMYMYRSKISFLKSRTSKHMLYFSDLRRYTWVVSKKRNLISREQSPYLSLLFVKLHLNSTWKRRTNSNIYSYFKANWSPNHNHSTLCHHVT